MQQFHFLEYSVANRDCPGRIISPADLVQEKLQRIEKKLGRPNIAIDQILSETTAAQWECLEPELLEQQVLVRTGREWIDMYALFQKEGRQMAEGLKINQMQIHSRRRGHEILCRLGLVSREGVFPIASSNVRALIFEALQSGLTQVSISKVVVLN